MISEVVRHILSNNAGVVALVGTKIYPVIFDERMEWPGIVYQVTDASGHPAKGEASKMDFYSVQIDTYSSKNLEAESIANAVRTALENYSGVVATKNVSNIEWKSSNDGYAMEPKLYRKISKYQFTIKT